MTETTIFKVRVCDDNFRENRIVLKGISVLVEWDGEALFWEGMS